MKNNTFFLLIICILSGVNMSISAQDLLEELEKEYPNTPQYEIATFKATRIGLGHSIETRDQGVLEIKASNLLWNLPNRPSQSFVADKWTARIALEYGLSNRLTFGVGGTTLDGIYDSFLKYRLFKQQKGGKGSPLSVSLFQNASYKSETNASGSNSEDFEDRLAFTTQVLIARKLTSQFSLQLSPTFIHRSYSIANEGPENHFALGIGARYKVGGHVSIASEYFYVANPLESGNTYNAFVLGVNWEMSDLMLQFLMTNARNAVEDSFILQTPNNFNLKDGNFVFGFNATFVLHLKPMLP